MANLIEAKKSAARSLLQHHWQTGAPLSWKASGFLGQMSCGDDIPTPRQSEWLGQLLERAGLAEQGGVHG